jgi:hypothetical protein
MFAVLAMFAVPGVFGMFAVFGMFIMSPMVMFTMRSIFVVPGMFAMITIAGMGAVVYGSTFIVLHSFMMVWLHFLILVVLHYLSSKTPFRVTIGPSVSVVLVARLIALGSELLPCRLLPTPLGGG